MITVTLYTRQGCHLCEQAKADLEKLKPLYPFQLIEKDIDQDEGLLRQYGLEIPVIAVGPYTLRAPIEFSELKMTLAAAYDRQRHIARVENSPALQELRAYGVWTGADRFSLWTARHYMAFFNVVVSIYLGLAFLAPVLMHVGATAPANLLYRVYSIVCHQLAYRSFFLYGEQYAYPRAAAHVPGLLTFEQATGLSEASTAQAMFQARTYTGEARIGYKVALCQRDIAIYGGILLFGLIFSLTGLRLKAIPWYIWIAAALVPIGLDGFSQLLSQPPINLWGFRESTPLLRVVTGGMFGFFTAWFGYPIVEESMVETRRYMTSKWERTRRSEAG